MVTHSVAHLEKLQIKLGLREPDVSTSMVETDSISNGYNSCDAFGASLLLI